MATVSSEQEHVAPGEEQVVFSRKAGVVASRVSYVDLLDSANAWQVLESPHEDEALSLTCVFNRRGTHLAIGDESARVDIWSLVPLRLHVKTLVLTRVILDALPAPAPFMENANGNLVSNPHSDEGRGGAHGMAGGRGAGKNRESGDHGWSTVSTSWSRCSQFILAAYVQKKKAWPDGADVLLPGLVILWSITEGQVDGFLRLRSRVAHVSLSPRNPRRGIVCCADGISYVLDFPAAGSVIAATQPFFSAVGENTCNNASGNPAIVEKASDKVVHTVARTIAKTSAQHASESIVNTVSTNVAVNVVGTTLNSCSCRGGGDSAWGRGPSNDLIMVVSPAMVSALPAAAAVPGAGENVGTGGVKEVDRPTVGPNIAPAEAAASVFADHLGGLSPPGGGSADSRGGSELLLVLAGQAVKSAALGARSAPAEAAGGMRAGSRTGDMTSGVQQVPEAGGGDKAGIGGASGFEGHASVRFDGGVSVGKWKDLKSCCDVCATATVPTAVSAIASAGASKGCDGDDGDEGLGAGVSVCDPASCSTPLCATTRTIWDPIRQLELFKCGGAAGGALAPSFAGTSISPNTGASQANSAIGPRTGLDLFRGTVADADTGSGNDTGNVAQTRPSSVSGANSVFDGAASVSSAGNGGMAAGGGGSGKSVPRGPVQVGRAVWCPDGETVFLLNHEGNVLKLKISADRSPTLLAKTNLPGGASPSTLELTPKGDKVLLATATKGLCLVPTDDLDLRRAEVFGENFGIRGSKNRFWGVAVLGDIHGRARPGRGKRHLTVIGNPSRTRDEKTDVFFFDRPGGQPERVDTPRREGVLSLACSPLRPMLVFLCPTGEVYFREQVLKTDFPGPWYPSGYVLIDNNVDYLEAEDQLDTVVTTAPNGKVLSKTQAHEVVVPWQHEAVTEEDSPEGQNEEVVDVEDGEDTQIWVDVGRTELRWIPPNEGSWNPEGGAEERTGGGRVSPRGSGQESFGGPLARLLGATPSLVKEARKRNRSSAVSETDAAAKRRRMLPKMLEALALKQKKYDEETIKRKRKLEEARAKAKRLKEKKASAVAAAAKMTAEEAVQKQESAALITELAETAARETAEAAKAATGRPPDVGLQAWLAREWSVGAAGCSGDRCKNEVGPVVASPYCEPSHNRIGSSGGGIGGYYDTAASQPRVGGYLPQHTAGTDGNSLAGTAAWRSPIRGGAAADAAAWVAAAVAGSGGGNDCCHQPLGTGHGGSGSRGGGRGGGDGSPDLPFPLSPSLPKSQLHLQQQQAKKNDESPSATSLSSISRTPKISEKSGGGNIKNSRGVGNVSSHPASAMWDAAGSTEASWGPAGSTESSWGALGLFPGGTPAAWGAPDGLKALYGEAHSTRHSREVVAVSSGYYSGGVGGESGSQHRRLRSTSLSASPTDKGFHGHFGERPTPPSLSGSPTHGTGRGTFGSHTYCKPNLNRYTHQQRAGQYLGAPSTTGAPAEPSIYPDAASSSGAAAAVAVARRMSKSVDGARSQLLLCHSSALSPTRLSVTPSPPPLSHAPDAGCNPNPNLTSRRPLSAAQLPPPPAHPFRGVSMLAEALAHGRPKSPPVPAGSTLPMGTGIGSARGGGFESERIGKVDDWSQIPVMGRTSVPSARGVGGQQICDARRSCGAVPGSAGRGTGGVGAGVEMLANALGQHQHEQQQQHLQSRGRRGGGGSVGGTRPGHDGSPRHAASSSDTSPAAILQRSGGGGVSGYDNQLQHFGSHYHDHEYASSSLPLGPFSRAGGEGMRGSMWEGLVPPASFTDNVAGEDGDGDE